jgi:selenocysteine-specific elongation factor
VELEEEHVLVGGDRFVLRGFTPLSDFGYTIGGGTVLHPHPPVRKGASKAVPAALPRLRSEDPYERVDAAFRDAGRGGLTSAEAAVRAGTGLAAAAALCDRAEREGAVRGGTPGAPSRRRWHRDAVAEAAERGKEALLALHDRFPDRGGFPREEVAGAFRGAAPDPALVEAALGADPAVTREGDFFLLPERRPRAVQATSPAAVAVLGVVERAGLSGPTRGEIAAALPSIPAPELDRTIEALVKGGLVVRVKELHFHPGAVEGAKGKLVSWLAERKQLSVGDFKEMTGLTRKYLIPLLEHFDATKVTLRVGETRILRKTGG